MDESPAPHARHSIADRLESVPTKPGRPPAWLRALTRLSPVVQGILISPFHRLLSGRLMLVTMKGRRTETIYTFPVGYLELDALVIALVPRAGDRGWWRNFVDPMYASITIRGGRTAALGFAPPPGSAEFAKAAEQALRASPLARRLLRAKLDREKQLSEAQAERLSGHARVVIFDRTPHLGPEDRIPSPLPSRASSKDAGATSTYLPRSAETEPALPDGDDAAPGRTATNTPSSNRTPSLDAMEAAELQITDLLGPVMERLGRDELPAAIALAERIAAERYRLWAKEQSDPAVRAVLDACAIRQDDIASRVEAVVAGALSIQESIARAHPQLAARYLRLFEGMTLPTQLAFQARLQRAATESWRGLAETSPPHVRGTLLECSYLEEQSASALEDLLSRYRTG